MLQPSFAIISFNVLICNLICDTVITLRFKMQQINYKLDFSYCCV